ncbi:D-aspartate oxidase-like [Dermatophagoides pteronyssinus]|nr:D-aspartate oxidase-like [Dermatophagoides pteronyssinus]
MLRGSKAEICVIGAGVVGLSTALKILSTIPSVRVTIVADKFLDNTLSFGAGGFFRPEINIGRDRQSIEQWASDSYEYYSFLASNEPESGNSFISGYQLSTYSAESMQNELVTKLTNSVQVMSDDERLKLFPEKFKYGIKWTSIITDPRHYLPYMQRKIENLGGTFVERHIDSFDELSEYDVIVNCTGLQAAKLANDFRLIPVRGQAFKVVAPWIKHFYFADGAYVLPGRDYVTVGGIKEFGSSNMAISQLDSFSIWKRCTEMVPSLQKAEIAFEWVGLRPHRQPVRVEHECYRLSDGTVRDIVHNYGHGAHGITLSWGTATEATDLIRDSLSHKAKLKSKL